MLKKILTCAALAALILTAEADPSYVATPLQPRVAGPAGPE